MPRGSSIAGALALGALLFAPVVRAQQTTILCMLPEERREEATAALRLELGDRASLIQADLAALRPDEPGTTERARALATAAGASYALWLEFPGGVLMPPEVRVLAVDRPAAAHGMLPLAHDVVDLRVLAVLAVSLLDEEPVAQMILVPAPHEPPREPPAVRPTRRPPAARPRTARPGRIEDITVRYDLPDWLAFPTGRYLLTFSGGVAVPANRVGASGDIGFFSRTRFIPIPVVSIGARIGFGFVEDGEPPPPEPGTVDLGDGPPPDPASLSDLVWIEATPLVRITFTHPIAQEWHVEWGLSAGPAFMFDLMHDGDFHVGLGAFPEALLWFRQEHAFGFGLATRFGEAAFSLPLSIHLTYGFAFEHEG